MLGPIQPELCHWIRRCEYVTLTHPIIRHLMRCPHKIIDDLQLENSNLMRRVKELEWNPRPSEEEEQSATEGNTVDTRSNQIRCFSRTYAYTVNMFIAAKECAPSKDAKNYHPSQRFGMHRREGDLHEFLDHLPEEFQDDLKNKDQLSFFFHKNC